MEEKKLKYYLNNKNFAHKIPRGKVLEKNDMLQVVDGKIVLNTAPVQAEEDEAVTSSTYLTKRDRGKKHWTKRDDEIFFESLECCGCEFSIMNTLFPERTRGNLREKYKRELRNNPSRVESALRNFTQFDLVKLQQLKDKASEA
ncbi:hypothetical protein PAPHI01_1181 [Pancytospora philotis]|nr:hypothetical protein PAPHI01_1181 [Pancytospora philotis]